MFDRIESTPKNGQTRPRVQEQQPSGVLAIAATGELRGTQLHEKHAYYRSSLELCRLYIEGRAVEHPTGEVSAPAFLFPMEQVFDAAVASYLAMKRSDLMIQTERSLTPISGEPHHTLTYRPDLIIGRTPPLLDSGAVRARAADGAGSRRVAFPAAVNHPLKTWSCATAPSLCRSPSHGGPLTDQGAKLRS